MDKRARMALLILILLLFTLLSGVAWAGRSDHYAVDWQVLSAGGAPAVSGSGRVALNASLGQTAIGPATNGVVTLGAGYWYGAAARGYTLYLPLVLRNY